MIYLFPHLVLATSRQALLLSETMIRLSAPSVYRSNPIDLDLDLSEVYFNSRPDLPENLRSSQEIA